MPAAAVTNLLDIDVVKTHLRLEPDFTDDDDYIEQLMEVALLEFEECTGRVLYQVGADISGESSSALTITARITQGCLLFIAHLYSNRSAVTERKAEALPMGVDRLWRGHRRSFL